MQASKKLFTPGRIVLAGAGALLVTVGILIYRYAYTPQCIVEGTRIDTPEGPRVVESLRAGDEVWTRDSDGRRQRGRVISVHPSWAAWYLEIECDGVILRVTPTHPIGTPAGWRCAGSLSRGEGIVRDSGVSRIQSIRHRLGPVRVFDLEVEPNPNFYAETVLVHNKSLNWRNATGTLKTFATAEADFRSNDKDGNGINDYWIADVSGLYFILDSRSPIKLIEISAALADANPRPNFGDTRYADMYGVRGPKAGYHFQALRYYEDESGRKLAYDDGTGRNLSRFGFLTYPAEYGISGTNSYIISEGHTLFQKDLKGGTVDTFPRDPLAQGWEKVD